MTNVNYCPKLFTDDSDEKKFLELLRNLPAATKYDWLF